MPPPYDDIPQLADWQSDSSAIFSLRSSDHVLVAIDSLLTDYHDVNLAAIRTETLFYLRSALLFWMSKVDMNPQNRPPTGLNSTNLPNTGKADGTRRRLNAIQALLVITNEKLRTAFAVGSDGALRLALVTAYGATNHGLAADQHWLSNPGHAAVSVYLANAGLQRMYKLRFRGGVGWRWNPGITAYSVFDSTDNRESETNDQMVHFVMSEKGRIFAGFDKDAVWFKHSSLVGGENALAAGRMKIEHGVVTFVENDSGHYQPNFKHMVNLLQRLRLYGCNLTNTRVRRVSDKQVFTAMAMLARVSSWPDGAIGH